MKKEYIVGEYSELFLPGYKLTMTERDYLRRTSTIHENTPWNQRFYFDELIDGLRFKTQSFVGAVELESIRIIIQPKFDRGFSQIVDMLLFAKGEPFYEVQESSGTNQQNNFFQMLVKMFLSQTEAILKIGLTKEYVSISEDLRNVRGRIQLRENAVRNYNLPTKLYCNYDELVTNITENQVILSVLQKVSKFPLPVEMKHQVNAIRTQFEMACEAYTKQSWPTIHYNRLNQHYKASHTIGEIIWSNLFVSNFQRQQAQLFSFLIDMNELFEQFVGQLFTKYLPSNQFKIEKGKRITNAITLQNMSYRHVIPDFVIHDTTLGLAHVIDTKYKHYDSRQVDTSDIFQLAFYAQYYQGESPKYEATIVYPVYANEVTRENRELTLNSNAANSGSLRLRSIQIDQLLNAVRNKKEEWLISYLLRMIKS